MSSEYSRREWLGLLGASAGGSVAVSGRGAATVGCDEAELEAARRRLAELEAERDRLPAETAALAAEIEGVEERLVEERARYPTDVRERARTVGESIRGSVAFLDIQGEHAGGEATGWFVESNLLLTNRHNVEIVTSDHDLVGWLPDGTSFEWEVLARADIDGPDVALLEADRSVDPIPVASDPPSTGDHLVQVGNPGGVGAWVVSLGEVLAVDEYDVVSDVPGRTGVSGSPVVDLDGEVVGITYGGGAGATATAGRPEPTDPAVHHELLTVPGDALHVRIDAAMELLEAWT